jgi:hypothetical protein
VRAACTTNAGLHAGSLLAGSQLAPDRAVQVGTTAGRRDAIGSTAGLTPRSWTLNATQPTGVMQQPVGSHDRTARAGPEGTWPARFSLLRAWPRRGRETP